MKILKTCLLPSGTKYNLLAHTTLTLESAEHSFKTHNLSINGNGKYIISCTNYMCYVCTYNTIEFLMDCSLPQGILALIIQKWNDFGGSSDCLFPFLKTENFTWRSLCFVVCVKLADWEQEGFQDADSLSLTWNWWLPHSCNWKSKACLLFKFEI